MSDRRRVAVVTGGNRGLGLATATALAGQGLAVLIASRKSADAEQATRMLERDGLRATPAVLDVSDPASIAAFTGMVDERFGGADVLVNNAGIYPDGGRSALAVPRAVPDDARDQPARAAGSLPGVRPRHAPARLRARRERVVGARAAREHG